MTSTLIPNPAFGRIGIMGRANKPSVIQSIYQICDFFHEQGLPLLIDHQTARLPALSFARLGEIATIERSLLGGACDLVIVVGGDGSLLHAAQVLEIGRASCRERV